MEKLKNLMLEKKYRIIFFCLLLVFLFLFASAIEEMFFVNNGSSYGDRLDGIKDVPITDDIISEVKNNIMLSNKVNKVSLSINGRLVNIIIDIKEGTDIIDSKQLSEDSLKYFSDKQKEYYDFQYFLTQKAVKNSDLYPIIGTKHKSKTVIAWTK